jgi:Beta-galactosidase trimerisation domain
MDRAPAVRCFGSFLAALAAAALLSCAALAQDASGITAPTTAPWLGQARIAGADLHAKMSDDQIAENLNALVEQNVSVVEADSDLSRFLTEAEFAAELDLMRRYSRAAHGLGLRVVWYYPVLEVLSQNVKAGGPTMYRTHPDWVQRGVNGQANVFYGKRGNKLVHWVEPDSESAWMSLHSPYADIFIERVKRVAATGVDGIWLDVPIYSDISVQWADAGPAAAAKFRADTGLDVPKGVNWKDPVWRRWIAWRYQEISSFILRTRDAARSVTGDIAVIVETVTLDYAAATMLGLDGSTMKSIPGVIQVWEVDTVSDQTGMRNARPDDWISLIGMSKFAKAASGTKPSWIFTYGKDPDDGLLVMAEALAAGNHPYETRVPSMATSVGAEYRKRMFSWIKRQEERLFASDTAAKVAVYFSPESRDYLDKAAGTGLFATTRPKPGDELWWSDERRDSVYSLSYLAEYRGIIKWLAHNHVPFDIVVRPDGAELSRYQTVIAPALTALSDRDADLLDRYAATGGKLVITGPRPASLDELGSRRDAAVLKSLQRGSAIHSARLLGKSYLASGSPLASRAIQKLLGSSTRSPVETNAGKTVHIELRKSGDEVLLHLVNPERLWNGRAPKQRDVAISIAMPLEVRVVDVRFTAPEPPAGSSADDKQHGVDLSARSTRTARHAKPQVPPQLARAAKTSNATPGEATLVAATDAPDLPAPPPPQAADGPQDGTTGKAVILPFTTAGNKVSFSVPLEAYGMVVISTRPR